ncbi:MAG: class I SAM-dependent methyltransferase [Candidatus Binatia bacterium]
MQDHLTFMGNLSAPAYEAFVGKLKIAMDEVSQQEMVDLCSGAGGPMYTILRLLRQQGLEARAQLTDLYPNLPAYRQREHESGGTIRGVDYSVDATNVPVALAGFRLIANGFHHFPPTAAVKILADAVAKGQGLAVIEMVNRSALAMFSVFVGLLGLLVCTPFFKPFRLSRLLWTYVLPIVPLCLVWDGIVSCLRVYSPRELHALVSQVEPNKYEWDIGELPVGPGVVTYLIGIPARATDR